MIWFLTDTAGRTEKFKIEINPKYEYLHYSASFQFNLQILSH